MKINRLLPLFAVFFLSSSCQTTKVQKNDLGSLSPAFFKQVSTPPGRERSQFESTGQQWMISTQGTASTQAGAEILKQGGNLFDAFAAISFAIGVERPHSTGLGGGGFALFYHAKEKKVYALDFRETAPRKAHEKMFLGPDGKPRSEKSLLGGLAIATPGLVAGVLEIQEKFGRLKRSEVLAPAIRLAEDGFPVYPALNRALSVERSNLALFPSSKNIFLNSNGQPWPIGHILRQPDLAVTLKKIAAHGAAGFYSGPVAEKMAKTVRQHKGLLDAEDLKNYKTKWRTPVQSTFHGYSIYSQPPPSSGGTHVIQILNTLEQAELIKSGPQSTRAVHLTASAMQRAFFDRAQFMGDPDFVSVPTDKLTSKSYAEKILKNIDAKKSRAASDFQISEESPDTVHFSLMDIEGNAIASTQTINGYFGSAVVAEGTGIVLNNEMDDFAAQVGAQNLFGAVGGKNNLIAPLKRPLSSMSPTLVMQDGLPLMAVGTPSGTKIITCVAQTLLNTLEYKLPLWESVTLSRYHHQWQPDQLQIEASGLPEGTVKELRQYGYNVVEKDLGCRIQAIRREGAILRGVSDPREEGSSRGL